MSAPVTPSTYTVYGLENSSSPYNFSFLTEFPNGNHPHEVVVTVSLPDGLEQTYDLSASRPTEMVNLGAGASLAKGLLTWVQGQSGELGYVTFTGNLTRGNVAELQLVGAWYQNQNGAVIATYIQQ